MPTGSGDGSLGDRMDRRNLALSALQDAVSTFTIAWARAVEEQQPQKMLTAVAEFRACVEETAGTSDDPVIQQDAEVLRAMADAVKRVEQHSVEDAMEWLDGVGLVGVGIAAPLLRWGHLGGLALETVAIAAAIRAVNSSGEERAAAWSTALELSGRLTEQADVSPLTLFRHARQLAGFADLLDDWPAVAPVLAAAVRAAGSLVSARSAVPHAERPDRPRPPAGRHRPPHPRPRGRARGRRTRRAPPRLRAQANDALRRGQHHPVHRLGTGPMAFSRHMRE